MSFPEETLFGKDRERDLSDDVLSWREDGGMKDTLQVDLVTVEDTDFALNKNFEWLLVTLTTVAMEI